MELEIGSRQYGFRIVSSEELAEIEGNAIIMLHEKSGAKLLYLKNDDENKAFSIIFKTPPVDSTGVFHILEHAVLCGSKKYPLKKPFVNLRKSSMHTFLNAMTFPDKTMFPVASTNDRDLMNLVDVYMDAVLNPLIYSKRYIFAQEGWHYEAGMPSEPLRYSGVVFNEMKGVSSDPDSVLYQTLAASLFPDTAYSYVSGGDPQAIPNLSYEQFLDSHRRHYRLDNSYIILYGNMKIEEYLDMLDTNYLSVSQPKASEPNALELQKPVVRMRVEKAMPTSPENASIGFGYVAGHVFDHRRILMTDILIHLLLGTNESPLKRALLDSGIADDVHGYLVDEQLQPFVVIQAKGCMSDKYDHFLSILEGSIAELVEEGIPKDKITAVFSHFEFILRERDFGIPNGVALAMSSLAGWLYDDSLAIQYLHYESAFEKIRAEANDGCFERLAKELFLENNHTASVLIVPEENTVKSAESKKLEAKMAEMRPEDLSQIMDAILELRREQDEPDSEEAISSLPLLSLDDMARKKSFEPSYFLDETTPLPCLHHDLSTRHIDYVYHYFDLDRVSYKDLPYVGVLLRLLGKFDTSKHSADELDSLVQTRLGTLRFYAEAFCRKDNPFDISPKFIVGASALEENVDFLAKLPSEIWTSTEFSNKDKVKDILQQYRIGMEQTFAASGHAAAIGRLASYTTSAALLRESMGGIGFYLFLRDLLDNFDERADSLILKLNKISSSIFSQTGTVTSFCGTSDECARFWEAGGSLNLRESTGEKRLSIPTPVTKREAFIIPSDVSFIAKGYDLRLLGMQYTGVWDVASRILSLDYLWNRVRLQGGAYGTGFKVERSGALHFYSYRDTSIDNTLTCFDEASGWCKAFDCTEEVMRGYIISSVAGFDVSKKPQEIAQSQDCEYFTGVSKRLSARQDALEADVESIRNLAPILNEIAEEQAVCVFGCSDAIESSKHDFQVADLAKGPSKQ